ncbi:MAG: peptidase M28 family protein, partial [Crocinitomicaceae bacterium]
MKYLFSILLLSCFAQISAQDSTMIRAIYDEALLRGEAYENLRSLCKDIGPRLSGSASAQMAVEWSEAKMKSYGFDRVYLQEIKVPHWERGTKENAWFRTADGKLTKVHLLALGGSI